MSPGLTVPKQHPVPKGLPVLENGNGPTPQQRAAMVQAAAAVRATGKAATVDALTTETQQVSAQPKGGFSLSVSAQPVRTQQAGKWVPIDTTLHRNPDGSYSPAATAYGGVTFSGGGRTPLATTISQGTSYVVSWPTALPAPAVSGSTATYANVLPDVDLVVSATAAGGFSDVIVVHTAAAAHNPALASLSLPTSITGGHLRAEPHGVVAIASSATGGNTLLASTPMMWDSNTNAAATTPQKAGTQAAPQLAPSAVDPSDTGHPGLAARLAVVDDRATPTALTLTPDHHLLTDPSTVFPLFIDPTFNWDNADGNNLGFDEVKQGSPCTNTSFFDNGTPDSGNTGMLGSGYNNWSSCIGVERTYLQWQLPSIIWGAHIGNVTGQPAAVVDVDKLYSASCATSTNYLHTAGGIGPGTSWNNQPGLGPVVATDSIPPTLNCPGNGDVKAGFNVSGPITEAAADHSSQFTVAITGNEARGNLEFSRFNAITQSNGAPPPLLEIYFNLPPNTPGPEWAASGSNNVGCANITPYPYMGKTILTNTPVLNATVSDGDPMDAVQATFHYWVDGSSTINTGVSADNLASGTDAQFALPPSFVTSLANGQVVDWQAQASDGEDSSAWGQVCHFIAEPTAPTAPTITSADGTYPNNGSVGAVYTTPGKFTMAATGGTTTQLVQNLDQAPPLGGAPAKDLAPFNGGASITPAARWKLSDNTGTSAADSSGNGHPASLHGGATWTTGTRGPVVSFNGTTGYASTTGPAINTEGSFTVSAWVDIKSVTAGNWQTFVVQQGATESGFYLERDPDSGDWSFSMVENDALNPPADRAESANPAQPGTWTHLVGVYDSANGAMTLYVNGDVAGTATDPHPIAATGPVDIGRGYNANAPVNYSNSSISDVQLYQYPLSASDVTTLYQGATIAPAGRWKFAEGSGSTTTDSSGNNHPATLTGGYKWSPGSPSGITLDGSTGYAATASPVLNTQNSFSVAAWVNINAANSNWQTAVSQQATTNSGFDLQRDPRNGDWSFSEDESDAPNPNGDYAESDTSTPLNTWVYLVGTYDAGSGAMNLYINGAESGSATNTHPIAANGPLVIGRAFYNSSPDDFVNGSISDVQTYQSALDASEVSQLYASSTFAVSPPSPGPHTLYGYAADAAGDASGYQAYQFIAAGDPNISCASLSACYNNVGISPDSNPGLADFDGEGNSFSATDLTNAGWTPGGKVTVDGGTFTLPQYATGQPNDWDNVVAANQTIANTDPTLAAYNGTVPTQGTATSGTSSLEFLTTATFAYTTTPGAINGDTTAPYLPAGTPVAGRYCFDNTNPAAFCAPTGTITYSDGSIQTYYLTVPDWVIGPSGMDTMWMPHENYSGGSQNDTNSPKMYAFSVPLKPGLTIKSVTLPDVGDKPGLTTAALHIFSMATRNTTTTSSTSLASAQTWTGSWASPSEADYAGNAAGGGYSNETFRVPVRPSLSGSTIRIKFDDALGNSPLQIGHATIAVQKASGSPVPTAAPVTLSFSNGQRCAGNTSSSCVVIPQGGMIYSDPITFTTTANQPLLVSFQLQNSTPTVPSHTWPTGGGGEWVSAGGSGDLSTDTTGTPFTASGSAEWASTSIVTGLDVTSQKTPTQAVVGDGFIDQAESGGTRPLASTNLADDLTATEATTPSPYGSIAEGIEANELTVDFPQAGNGGGPSALSRIDRDILDQPGITTVIFDEGLEDVLAHRTSSTGLNEEQELTDNELTALISDLKAYNITATFMGLPPCDGYAGDGASPNDDCTSSADTQRTGVNRWLSNNSYIDYISSDVAIGIPDTSNGETKLNPAADGGDHVNLTNAGFAALANTYLGAQDSWLLNDGAVDPTTTLAADSASNANGPYLVNDLQTGNNPITLNGKTAWPTDPTRGTVLGLDGSSTYGQAPGQTLTTTGSFTVSAWANLAATTHNADIITQDGSQDSGFALQYDQSDNRWAFTMPASDTANPTYIRAMSTSAPTTGTWTHLVGTYNAPTHTLSLYVNGALAGTATDATPINATGTLTLGRGQVNAAPTDYFTGDLSSIQTWNYALTATQVTALYQQIN
jgi:hypothetical protein